MSISSAIAAEWSNKIKDEWVNLLKDAYDRRDWEEVSIVIEKMRKYRFSE